MEDMCMTAEDGRVYLPYWVLMNRYEMIGFESIFLATHAGYRALDLLHSKKGPLQHLSAFTYLCISEHRVDGHRGFFVEGSY